MKVLIRRQMMQVQVAEKNVEAARQKLEEVMKERKTQENYGKRILKISNNNWRRKITR